MLCIGAVVVAVVVAGCRDAPPAASTPVPSPVQDRVVTSAMQCTANVTTGRVDCRKARVEPSANRPGHAAIVPNSDSVYWVVQTANPSYAPSSSVFSLDVALKNDSFEALGTRDGTTALGFKMLLVENPVVTELKPMPNDSVPVALTGLNRSDTASTVYILNPDGRQALISANQPFFYYPEKLEPAEVSSYHTWRFHVPSTVQTFMFAVLVFAPLQGESAMTDTVPHGFLISNDSVMKLYAPARLIHTGSRFAGPYPPDVVLLQFRPTATLAEKQAALDLVRGSVIGGGWGSFYYVQVPDDDNPDGGVQTAIDRLVTLPQVQRAMPDITIGTVSFSRRPREGTGGRPGKDGVVLRRLS